MKNNLNKKSILEMTGNMRTYSKYFLIMGVAIALVTIGCGNVDSVADTDSNAPSVSSTTPVNVATEAALNTKVTATFNKEMAASTITGTSFTLKEGAITVPATVTYSGLVATLNPTNTLAFSTVYTATVSTDVKDLAGNFMATTKSWTFTTSSTSPSVDSPAVVNLGTAGNFLILAKSKISTTSGSALTGDIGVSPVAASYITGFSLIADSSNVFSTSSLITGKVYASDYAVPTPANLTTAVSNMETAYTDAAGRPTPDFINLGAGEIGGLTLVPGLYKWGTGVLITTDVTLNGGPNDVWIFQIAQGITMASGKKVILTGGALAKNIFWQSFGTVSLDTTAHFEGIILSQTAINLSTGATVNGRLLAQTAVTLQSNTLVEPAL